MFAGVEEHNRGLTNMVFSPTAIELIIDMLKRGQGTKKGQQAINQVLGYLSVNSKGLIEAAEKSKSLVVKCKGYVDNHQKLDEDFNEELKEDFKVSFSKLDFGNPQSAAKEINSWASKVTDGLIEDVMNPSSIPPDPRTALVLLSAVVFQGKWANRFNPHKTTNKTFHAHHGKVEVPMMYLKRSIRNIQEEDGSVVFALPYEDLNIHMVVFFDTKKKKKRWQTPTKPQLTMDELHAHLFETNTASEVELYMPKFKIETELKDIQKYRTFRPLRDLDNTKMLEEGGDLEISSFNQKAFIEVDEKGTKAAAVASVSVAFRSLISTPKIIVDKPFFFSIYAVEQKQILFQGWVQNPAEIRNWKRCFLNSHLLRSQSKYIK